MTATTNITPSVRPGTAAVAAVAVVGVGSAIGIAIDPSWSATPEFGSSVPVNAFPGGLVVLFAVCQGLLFATGTVLVARMVMDVRRRRTLVATPVPVDSALSGALDRLEGEDGAGARQSLVEAVMSLTSAARADVYDVDPASGAALCVATSAGSNAPDAVVDLDAVLTAAAPRRWVESDGEEHRAVMAVPLLRDGVVVGVVVGLREGDQPFGLLDLDVTCQLALAASSAGALIDVPTNLPNRRRFDRDVEQSLGAVDAAVGLAVVDVDHFTLHLRDDRDQTRDALLGELSVVLSGAVRDGDVVYSWGEGRFGVLLAGADDTQTAEVAERLRVAAEEHYFESAGSSAGCRLTVSVGTAIVESAERSHAGSRAEDALDVARHDGGNRVVASSAA